MVIGVAEQNGRPCLPPAGLPPEQIDCIQKELLKKSDWAFYIRKRTSTVKATGEAERELIEAR